MKKGKHLLHRHSIHPRHAVITGRNFDTLNEDRLREWLEEETCGKVKQVVLLTNEHNVYPEWHALVVKACEVAPVRQSLKSFLRIVTSCSHLFLDTRNFEEKEDNSSRNWFAHPGMG